MTDVNQLITEHLEIWTTAIEKKSSAGRGNGGAVSLHGINKLREMIFELAVRGKLLAQDESDSSVERLLLEVAKERRQVLKDRKDAGKWSEPFKFEEPKLELPEGWKWVPLADVLNWHVGGGTPPKTRQEYWNGGIPWASVKDVGHEKFLRDTVDQISSAGLKNSSSNLVPKGCLLIITRMGLGRLSINEIDVAINQDIRALSVSSLISLEYCYLFFKTLKMEGVGLTVKGVKVSDLLSSPFPLPPVAEQHRIVAKVDELMALCDALERQTEDGLKAHQVLVETCLAILTKSQSPEELTQNWTRIEANFDTLFTTEESIAQLERTVIQLAIRGSLAKQDYTEDPASKWLERSIKTKDMLVKAKKIRKPKATKSIDVLTKPFELPETWTWARLPEIGELARGKSKHRPRNDRRLFDGGSFPLVQTGDVARANPHIVEAESFYNEFGLEQSRLWPKGTLCITIAANIADTGILSIDACFPDSVVGFIPFEDDVDVSYFDYFIRTAKNDLEHYAPSTAQKNINLEILGEILVPLPPKEELNRICKRVSELLEICRNLRRFTINARVKSVELADALTSQIH